MALPIHAPLLVHVVHIAVKRKAQTFGETQQEAACQIAVFRAARRLHIGHKAITVFAFQLDVHNVGFRVYVRTQRTVAPALLFIHLYFLHHIIGQVLHEHFAVSLEELAGLQLKLVNFPSVHEYLALLVHRHTRQLADEVIQHTAVGQVERIGIVDERVAIHVELHLRCPDDHLVEVYLLTLGQSPHVYGAHVAVRLTLVQLLYHERHVLSLETVGFGQDEVLSGTLYGSGDEG